MLEPTLAYSFSMFNESRSRNCARTMSSIVRMGNLVAYRSPFAGSIEDGPVEPKHPPITFVHITKYLYVSSGFPGPMKFSHHPGCGLISVLCAWLEADNPVCNRTALLLSLFKVPHVSYATLNSGSMPPQSSNIGSRERKLRCFPVVYEGSGPEERLESEADRDSSLSRHGKASAGFVESATGSASGWETASWAPREAWM
jgi:hypothetical protein